MSKIEEAAAEVILQAAQSAGEAKEFVLEQAPDVVQQLIYWEIASGLMWCGFWLLLGGFIASLLFVLARATDDSDCYFMGVIAFILSMFAAWVPLASALKAWVAPKVFLIEYAASLVRSAS